MSQAGGLGPEDPMSYQEGNERYGLIKQELITLAQLQPYKDLYVQYEKTLMLRRRFQAPSLRVQ